MQTVTIHRVHSVHCVRGITLMFSDFAVGAPYDGPNHQGAVYIFLGSRDGVMKKPSQVGIMILQNTPYRGGVRLHNVSITLVTVRVARREPDTGDNRPRHIRQHFYTCPLHVTMAPRVRVSCSPSLSVKPLKPHLCPPRCKA